MRLSREAHLTMKGQAWQIFEFYFISDDTEI